MFVCADLITVVDWINFKKKNSREFIPAATGWEVGIQPGQVTSPWKDTDTTIIYSHTPQGNLDLQTYCECFWTVDPTREFPPQENYT